MFKYTVTYDNYNDEEVTEDLYFHLTEVDLMEMETEQQGGLDNYVKRIISAKDTHSLIQVFKSLLLKSYGVKDVDGKFHKSPEITENFVSSGAYPVLFTKLSTDDKFAAEFVMGIIPKKIRNELDEKMLFADKQ